MKESIKFDVIVIGELNIDLILNKIDAFPVMGKEILAKEMTITLGSSSAIFANNLSILGSKVTYLGKVGMDSFGEQVCASLEKSGVDIGNIIKTAEFLTGLTVAMSYDNDRAMLTYPGAMNDLGIKDISDAALKSASHMHLSSVFLQEGLKPDVVRIFKKAKEHGLTTSFDSQWDPHEKWEVNLEELLPYVDVFLPNESEVKEFTHSGTIEDAISKIKAYSNIIVVKNGVNGAYMWDKEKIVEQKAFLNENVLDAIGAGDSFNSGFIYKYTKGEALEKCLEFATLTGAINTTAAGGTSAFDTIEKVRALAKSRFNYTF